MPLFEVYITKEVRRQFRERVVIEANSIDELDDDLAEGKLDHLFPPDPHDDEPEWSWKILPARAGLQPTDPHDFDLLFKRVDRTPL